MSRRPFSVRGFHDLFCICSIIVLVSLWAGPQAQGQICVDPVQGDVNGDCIVDIYDLAEMASNWLYDCWAVQGQECTLPPGIYVAGEWGNNTMSCGDWNNPCATI